MPPANSPPKSLDLAEFAWLASPEASRWLIELAASDLPLHTLTEKLRRDVSATRSHLLLEQADLRRKAPAKFTRSAQMLFTPKLLEQATDEWISRHKAERFADHATAADLCCGAGGDFLGLAEVSRATAIDRCEIASFCADHNSDVYKAACGPRCTVQTAEVSEIDLAEFAAWHIDPDRRPQGKRTTRVELHEPDLGTIEQMLVRQPNAAIKLAPASDLPKNEAWTAETEFEWISRASECRQLVAWRGSLAKNQGMRRATQIGRLGTTSFLGNPEVAAPVGQGFDQCLFEPDTALLAAHLTGALAEKHDLRAITPGVAYLTGPKTLAEPLLTGFQILDTLPLDRRTLAAYLRQRGVGRVEIKHRGLELDPDRLRAELKLRGDAPGVLIITKIDGRATVFIAQRIAG